MSWSPDVSDTEQSGFSRQHDFFNRNVMFTAAGQVKLD